MPAPKKSPVPRRRPREIEIMAEERAAAERGNRAAEREARDAESLMPQRRSYGGKVKKMMNGGTCRGMGAATRGGKYSRG